jgi:hypothetical protein
LTRGEWFFRETQGGRRENGQRASEQITRAHVVAGRGTPAGGEFAFNVGGREMGHCDGVAHFRFRSGLTRLYEQGRIDYRSLPTSRLPVHAGSKAWRTYTT